MPARLEPIEGSGVGALESSVWAMNSSRTLLRRGPSARAVGSAVEEILGGR